MKIYKINNLIEFFLCFLNSKKFLYVNQKRMVNFFNFDSSNVEIFGMRYTKKVFVKTKVPFLINFNLLDNSFFYKVDKRFKI